MPDACPTIAVTSTSIINCSELKTHLNNGHSKNTMTDRNKSILIPSLSLDVKRCRRGYWTVGVTKGPVMGWTWRSPLSITHTTPTDNQSERQQRGRSTETLLLNSLVCNWPELSWSRMSNFTLIIELCVRFNVPRITCACWTSCRI